MDIASLTFVKIITLQNLFWCKSAMYAKQQYWNRVWFSDVRPSLFVEPEMKKALHVLLL